MMARNTAAGGHKATLFHRIIRNRALLLMLLPAFLITFVLSYVPMGGIVLAFKKYDYRLGLFGSKWNGFDNFRYLFISGKLGALVRHTILYNAAFIIFGLIFEVGFAVMLNEITAVRFKKLAQTFMFLPYFISWVVVSSIMLNIFGSNGVLNTLLKGLGAQGYSVYKHPKEWPIVLVLIKLWKSTGYGTVVYLAAIVGINPDINEAAKIDGANIWQRIFRITIPMLRPTIIIMLLLAVGNIFRGDFGMFYQLVGGNQLLLETSDILDTYVYRTMMSNSNMGMSAAAGLFQSILCFITINVFNYTVKLIEPDYVLY